MERKSSFTSSLLHTDDSMQLEDLILEKEEQISSCRLNRFRIGQQTFDYDFKDPVFGVKGENKQKIKGHDCYSCKFVTFQKEKYMNFCKFCGHAVCKDCFDTKKTRVYPKSKLTSDGQRDAGPICKLCDRKFLVRQIFLKDYSELGKKDAHLEELEKQIAGLNSEI